MKFKIRYLNKYKTESQCTTAKITFIRYTYSTISLV